MPSGFRILTLLVAAGLGFGVTYVNVEPQPVAISVGRFFGHAVPVLFSVQFKPELLGSGQGVSLAAAEYGVEVRSKFDRPNAAGSTAGAVYFNLDSTRLKLPTVGRLWIEIDATYEIADISQFLEIRIVQNGLRVLDWQSQALIFGHQTYRFAMTAVSDNRPEPKIDTIWIRSDAEGRGRPVTLRAMRILKAV